MNPDSNSNNVDPSKFHLDLNIPGGQALELTLFEALLSYTDGLAVIINVHDKNRNERYLLHGRETCELLAVDPEGPAIKGKVFYLETDDIDGVGRAFYAEDCDWPEMLEVGRQSFMDGGPRNESYVAWLRHEIAKRRVQ